VNKLSHNWTSRTQTWTDQEGDEHTAAENRVKWFAYVAGHEADIEGMFDKRAIYYRSAGGTVTSDIVSMKLVEGASLRCTLNKQEMILRNNYFMPVDVEVSWVVWKVDDSSLLVNLVAAALNDKSDATISGTDNETLYRVKDVMQEKVISRIIKVCQTQTFRLVPGAEITCVSYGDKFFSTSDYHVEHNETYHKGWSHGFLCRAQGVLAATTTGHSAGFGDWKLSALSRQTYKFNFVSSSERKYWHTDTNELGTGATVAIMNDPAKESAP